MLNKSLWRVWVAVALLIIASLACNFSFSTANIGEAYMATDEDGNDKTSKFVQSDTIYAILELKNAPDDTELKAIWYTIEAEGEEPNAKILESDISGSAGQYNFSLTNDALFPLGTYKVELLLNGKVEKTLNFEIVVE